MRDTSLDQAQQRAARHVQLTPRARVDGRSCRALLLEWCVCVVALGACAQWPRWWVIASALCVIATRQHALFILYHDAVHGLIARDRRLNDLIINVAVGAPLLIPVHIYRRFHVSHHAHLGTPHDTERILLYRWQLWRYRPLSALKLTLQLLGDALLINQLLTGFALWWEQRRADTPLRLPRPSAYPETYLVISLFWAGVIVWFVSSPETALWLASIWFGALLTLTQLIQKLRSFAEHGAIDSGELTYSWRPGRLARLILWPYHINYHREHHARPGVPWHQLPTLSAQLPPERTRASRELIGLLWAGAHAQPELGSSQRSL